MEWESIVEWESGVHCTTQNSRRTLYPEQWESSVEHGVDWESKVECESIVQWESGEHCTQNSGKVV